jgi:protein phosphatase
MGTTLTAAYSLGLDLFVVHAGDSRTYLWHGGTLQQITKDHTVAQTLFEEGRIEQEELKTHRFRNVLTNYVGNPIDGIDTEMHRVELNVGDRLLLCSDGLSDMVDDEAIEAIMAGSGSPAEACEQLIAAALAGGGKDNVTAVVAYYSAGA